MKIIEQGKSSQEQAEKQVKEIKEYLLSKLDVVEVCNTCDCKFKLELEDIKFTKRKDLYLVFYYSCPNCGRMTEIRSDSSFNLYNYSIEEVLKLLEGGWNENTKS